MPTKPKKTRAGSRHPAAPVRAGDERPPFVPRPTENTPTVAPSRSRVEPDPVGDLLERHVIAFADQIAGISAMGQHVMIVVDDDGTRVAGLPLAVTEGCSGPFWRRWDVEDHDVRIVLSVHGKVARLHWASGGLYLEPSPLTRNGRFVRKLLHVEADRLRGAR